MSVKLGDVEVAGLQDTSGKADTSLSNLTATGKANVSAQGTYDSGKTYTAGTVGAAIAGKVTKGHEVIAFQAPTAQNNYTWYRKYADGWVEQGGVATTTNTSTPTQCNLPVTMANTTYQTSISIYNGSSYWASWGLDTNTRTTNTVTLSGYLNAAGDAAALPVFWEVKGMAA